MKKLLALLAFALCPLAAQAQTPGAQPEFCVTSPSQTANYNQLCISASTTGGAIGVTNFGSAAGGLGVGTITSGTWNGSPISNPFILNPFTTINGTTCSLGASCVISAPTSGIVIGTSTITSGTTNQLLYDNGGVVGEITKGNSCLYGTNSGGVPSCLTTLPASLSASSWTMPSLTVTAAFTATGLVTNADLVNTVITVNTVPCTLGSSCTIAASASLVVGSTSVTSGTTNQLLYDNGGTLGEVTKGNSCVYGTNGSGTPSCVTTLPFTVSLATGGSGANLTASTGGVVYSGASALAILAGTATASLPLLSGSSAAPTWATIAYPTSANSGGIPYFSSSSVISSSGALSANCIVYGGGTGTTPATSATGCPTVSNAGVLAVAAASSFTGTMTMPDSTTWGASGLSAVTVSGNIQVGGGTNTIGVSRVISINGSANSAVEVMGGGNPGGYFGTDGSSFVDMVSIGTIPFLFVTNGVTRLTIGGTGIITPAGTLNLGSVVGAGAASKYVCVDASNNVLVQSAAC